MPKKKPSAPIPAEYDAFLKAIKQRIYQANYAALKQVNAELIRLYWDIGTHIVEKQETVGWGKAVVETLAKDLQKEFPGTQGYSARNLWYMRTFYLEYRADQKLQPLVAEIAWTHNLIIMERCKDLLQREFYLRATNGFIALPPSAALLGGHRAQSRQVQA